jgi:hypothetical protein
MMVVVGYHALPESLMAIIRKANSVKEMNRLRGIGHRSACHAWRGSVVARPPARDFP